MRSTTKAHSQRASRCSSREISTQRESITGIGGIDSAATAASEKRWYSTPRRWSLAFVLCTMCSDVPGAHSAGDICTKRSTDMWSCAAPRCAKEPFVCKFCCAFEGSM